jgi:hypothetical protein
MQNSLYYRQKAERCRALLEVAVVPEVREQLCIWQREFVVIAESIEKRQQRRGRMRAGWNRVRKVLGASG